MVFLWLRVNKTLEDSSSFNIPLNQLVQAVKLLEPYEATPIVKLAVKVASFCKQHLDESNSYDLNVNDQVKFTMVLDINDSRKSSTEAFLNFKLLEASPN